VSLRAVRDERLSQTSGRPYRFTFILEKGAESGFVAVCPTLPGCVSQGRTRRETLKNIREAVSVYIEALLEDGLPAPRETGRETVHVEVAVR